MCENERIRFVHLMQHPDYPHELRVGCVCAEKMSDDYVNPRKAEDTLRKRTSRRKNFNNKEWRFNPEKQIYSKKYKGEYITIKKVVMEILESISLIRVSGIVGHRNCINSFVDLKSYNYKQANFQHFKGGLFRNGKALLLREYKSP